MYPHARRNRGLGFARAAFRARLSVLEFAVRTILLATIMLSAVAGCESGTPSLASRLPANNEIDTWRLSESPAVISSDTALYNQIDGGAAKYIDRGWLSCVYATYQQGNGSLYVAVHNMGSSDNAQWIFAVDLPPSRIQIDDLPSAVVDMGLATGYAANAYAGQYYIEISIDERSASALDYIQRFVVATMNRCR